MKLNILAAGFLLISISSCKRDFLQIAPQNFVSSTNFFKTQADFEQAVNATYAPLRNLYNDAYIMGEMRSDNTHYIYNATNRGNLVREEIADFIDNPTSAPVANKWTFDYRIIANANEVLARIDATTFADSVKRSLKGQELFLRALSYFDLVQYFGDVPLILTPTAGSAEEIIQVRSTLTKTPKAEVYTQILKDAQEAANLLPTRSQQAAVDRGRATSGAAKTLLANVHVVLKQWPQAETLLKELVNAPQYSLLADYAAVFDPANKNNAESIFEVQYQQGNLGLQSQFAYTFLPNITDLRPIVGFTFNNGSIGGWNTPTEDLINVYESGDKRKAASIADGYTAANGSFVATPYIRKYVHLPLPAPNGTTPNTNENWPVYRFAEVLLYLAEALNEQGKSAEALTHLNKVRDRAFGTGIAAITTTDQAQLRTILLKERRTELAFENKRWLDLVRTGRAIEVLTAYGTKVKANPTLYYYPTGVRPLASAYNVTQNRLLFPLPFSEVQLNPKLVQNPGY